MNTFLWILLSTFLLSASSLIGATALFLKEKNLKKIIHPLVAFSAGALIGGAFLHLLPEALGQSENVQKIFLYVIAGFAVFFLLEQFIHWHHCHKMPSEHKHPVTYMILASDTIHNFLDGLAIGASFLVDLRLGISTTLAIAMHELPQEMGDFGVLIHGGWKKDKALLFNFLSGLSTIFGGVLVYFLGGNNLNTLYLLPFAAGNFIYIAASDLIPEVKHRDNILQNGIHFAAFALGIILMWSMTFLE